MKNNLYKKIEIMEKKIEMLEEFSNEISHYIAKLEQNFKNYKETLSIAIKDATDNCLNKNNTNDKK